MSTQTTSPLVELAIQQLHSSRGFLNQLLVSLSDDQLLVRAGGAGNHALWVMGHLAVADDLFVSGFLGEEKDLPDSYRELFDIGSQPMDDAERYPSRTEVHRQFELARERLITWGQSLEGDRLWQPAPDSIAAITPNAISALHTLSQHDLFHGGQVATIRAFLGMEPLFSPEV